MYTTLLIAAAVLLAPASDPLQSRADEIVKLVNSEIADPSMLFHEAFLAQVPPAQLKAISDQLVPSYGKATRLVLDTRKTDFLADGTIFFEDGTRIPTNIGIESEPPHKVHTLWFGAPISPAKSFDEVIKELRELPGKTNFQVLKLGEKPKPVASHNPNLPLAIGSTFKLYVLGALPTGNLRWDKVVPLRAEDRSLPGGVMQTWPAGAPVTIHTLAAEMISISDNTATDALIRLVGRDVVEKQVAAMGHSKPKTTFPFLTTGEMFRIKSDAELLKRYISADESARRELLAGRIANMSLGGSPYTSGKPIAVDKVEWFASAADLCKAMAWFDTDGTDEQKDILAINPGVPSMKDRFAYIGYKGGSEPGALNMTWLLHTKKGTHFALSVGWNNTEKEVDISKLLGIAQSAMLLIEGD